MSVSVCPYCAGQTAECVFWLQKGSTEGESEEEPDKPRFTVPELRDVLQERNELKAQVFVLQEELAYYKRYILYPKWWNWSDLNNLNCVRTPVKN